MLAGMTNFLRGLACCAVLLLACTTKPETPPPATSADESPKRPGGSPSTDAPPKLEGRVFLSQTVTEDGKPRALVEGTQLSLSFDEGSRVGANAGCNSMGGRYAIEGGKLVITDSAITEMACPGRLEQESWYMKILLASPAIVVDGNTLVLEGGGTRIEYLDREVATPDLELVGPTWKVDTIISGLGAQHAAWPKPATLVFEADGKLKVFAGCNGGEGTYRVSGKELTFESVGLTEKACEDPLVNELETAVAALFHGPQPVTWEITVDRLSLRGKDRGLDLVASKG
jgi:heat shock protein HslJ